MYVILPIVPELAAGGINTMPTQGGGLQPHNSSTQQAMVDSSLPQMPDGSTNLSLSQHQMHLNNFPANYLGTFRF